MDVLILSRIQFAFTIGFHYIYPQLSVGISVLLVIIEGMYLLTKDEFYKQMAKFWVKIFALTFALGVATGIVMEFEFGTNWATYSRYVGDIFGSALAAEGIFAFFLESGFLAILLFGWNRVKPATHFFATLMVALGAHFSAIWITVANSWMQTPAGFHIVGEGMKARAEVTDFWAMALNPSSLDRIYHVYMGCWQSGAWLALSVSAYYLLKKRHAAFAQSTMKIGLLLAVVSSLLQLHSGSTSAEGVAKHQPAKLAAMEGHFPASAPAGMYLGGVVDVKGERVYGVEVPGMLSWLVYGDPSAPVTGLNAFPPENRPPVQAVFQAYHAMIVIGMGLIGLSLLGMFLWWRGKLFDNKWVLRLFVIAVLGPQIANQLGWFTAEVGRQPWIVYNLLRTSEGLSKTVQANQVLASLILFSLVYVLLFALFIFLLDHKIRRGPVDEMAEIPETHRADA